MHNEKFSFHQPIVSTGRDLAFVGIEGLNDSKDSVGPKSVIGQGSEGGETVARRPERGRLFWLLVLSQAFCLVWVLVNVLAFDIGWRLARPVSLGVVWAIEETAGQSGLPVETDHSLVGALLFMALFFSTIVGFQWVTVRGSTLLLEYLPIPRQSWPFELEGLRLARLGVLGIVGSITLLAALFAQPWIPAARCVSCGHVPAAIIGGLFGAVSGPILVWWLRAPKPTVC